MYSVEHLKIGLREPSKIFWEAVSAKNRMLLRRNDPPITDQDWDNLLILDACRHDLFQECFRNRRSLTGDLDYVYSVASATGEFIRRTFRNQNEPEIVCVTSTPKYAEEEAASGESMTGVFHDIIRVWEDDWDEEHKIVLPEKMNERVLETAEKYPNKRIFAHYIPPHTPFIGPTGKEMAHSGWNLDPDGTDGDVPNVWDALRRGEYDRERVWRAYKENLKLTLPAVEEMLEQLAGKTVVTSDHGEAFGTLRELRYTGHGAHKHLKSLIKVPWLVHHNGERKEIIQGDTEGAHRSPDYDIVQERLRDLGYEK